MPTPQRKMRAAPAHGEQERDAAATISAAPGSRACAGVRGAAASATRGRSSDSASAPIGRLIQKIIDQCTWSVRKPPSTGPSTLAAMNMAAE